MGLIAVDLMGGSTGVANNLAACAEFRSAKDLVLVGQREAVQGTASAQILAVNGATFLYAEDFELFLRMSELGRLANLPETLLQYRIHPKRRSEYFYQLFPVCTF